MNANIGRSAPVAYTYEAGTHCPQHTEETFGRGPNGYIAEGAVDSEGNEVHAVFPWDEFEEVEFCDEGHTFKP